MDSSSYSPVAIDVSGRVPHALLAKQKKKLVLACLCSLLSILFVLLFIFRKPLTRQFITEQDFYPEAEDAADEDDDYYFSASFLDYLPWTRSSNDPTITFITGTHTLAAVYLNKMNQDPLCCQLSDLLFTLWMAPRVDVFNNATLAIDSLLDEISTKKISCVLTHTETFNATFSFPVSFLPESHCDDYWQDITDKIRRRPNMISLPIDFYMFRPDLVKLKRVLMKKHVNLKLGLVISSEYDFASFSREGCDRICVATPIPSRERLLWSQLAHLQNQLEILRGKYEQDDVVVRICDGDRDEKRNDRVLSKWLGLKSRKEFCLPHDFFGEEEKRRKKLVEQQKKESTLTETIENLPIFHDFKQPEDLMVKKTIFQGPKVVFLAGVEGVGHHAFYQVGQPFFLDDTRNAMRNYLGSYPHMRNSQKSLVTVLKTLKLGLHFLNPDLEANNVYSFPFGVTHDCLYSREGRSICNPDLVDLAKLCEQAKVDFKILLLERTFGSDLIADSIHRHISSTFDQAKVLTTAQSVLKSSLAQIDGKFVVRIRYQDTLNNPRNVAKFLAEQLDLELGSLPHKHFIDIFGKNRMEHHLADNETDWHTVLKGKLWEYLEDMQELFDGI